jgi:hypothetical protein
MSGGNDIPKFARVNRENEIVDIKSLGTEFHRENSFVVITSIVPSANIFLNSMVLDATTPNAMIVSGLLGDTIGASLAARSLNVIGQQWTIDINNTDAVAKNFTMPVGFTPALLTVPPGYNTYTFMVTSTAPEQVSLVRSTSSSGGGGGGAVTSVFGRVGPVTAVSGDYDSTLIDNSSNILGGAGSVTDALNNINTTLTTGVVTSFIGRTGPVTAQANDYTTDQIQNTSAVIGGPHPSATDALNALQTQVTTNTTAIANKVTLGNALAQGDLLVATAAGDNYVPSATNLGFPAHMAAAEIGQIGTVALTGNQAVTEVIGDGPNIASNIRARLGPVGSGQNNYSAVLADVGASPAFGVGLAQSGHRVLVSAAAPPGTGGNGAYAFMVDDGASRCFFVNNLGHVRVTLSGGGPITGPLFLDGNGMLCV